jgi:hypothetical protein
MKNDHRLPKQFWAGFTEGKIDLGYYETGDDVPYGILYTNKRDAKTRYQDVRRVELREVKK